MDHYTTLEEVLAAQRKSAFWGRLACLLLGTLLAVLIGAGVWLAPRAAELIKYANTYKNEIDSILTVVNSLSGENSAAIAELAGKLGQLDMAKLNSAIAKLEGIDLSGLDQALSMLSSVDFERLNAAINTLDTLREPLSRFATLMGG